MKQTLVLVLSLVFFSGCLGGYTTSKGEAASPSRSESKTFAEHYEELEKEPVPTREQMAAMPNNLQTADDRAAAVAAEAQAERRGEPPLIESNYIFKVRPNKNVYSSTVELSGSETGQNNFKITFDKNSKLLKNETEGFATYRGKIINAEDYEE